MRNLIKIDDTLNVKYWVDQYHGLVLELYNKTDEINEDREEHELQPTVYREFYPMLSIGLKDFEILKLKKELGRARYKAIRELPLEFTVRYTNIRMKNHLSQKDLPKKAQAFLAKKTHKQKIHTVGDYLDIILMFQGAVYFYYAKWWKDKTLVYDIRSDKSVNSYAYAFRLRNR